MFLPEDDRYSNTKQRLESQICTLYGGRIAEELIFGKDKVTTGASSDIERATEIAKNMVTKWGLSDKMGPMSYSDEDGEVFLGHSVTQHKTMSDDTAKQIDSEVRKLINKSYDTATKMINDNMDKLHAMSEALLMYETIDKDQIDDIMSGVKPRPPKGWDDDNDDNDKKTSSQEQVKNSGFTDTANSH
jgi:cell division protease FtsH